MSLNRTAEIVERYPHSEEPCEILGCKKAMACAILIEGDCPGRDEWFLCDEHAHAAGEDAEFVAENWENKVRNYTRACSVGSEMTSVVGAFVLLVFVIWAILH